MGENGCPMFAKLTWGFLCTNPHRACRRTIARLSADTPGARDLFGRNEPKAGQTWEDRFVEQPEKSQTAIEANALLVYCSEYVDAVQPPRDATKIFSAKNPSRGFPEQETALSSPGDSHAFAFPSRHLRSAQPALSDAPAELRSHASFASACSILSSVFSLPSTSSVSNKGGAFLRPQTATRIG